MDSLDDIDEQPIDLADDATIELLLLQLGCTLDQLRAAVDAVGPRVVDVERHLAAHAPDVIATAASS